MPNHPNRSKRNPHPSRTPDPSEVVSIRARAGLTQKEAAELIHCSTIAWQKWEAGERRMHPAFFELFTIKMSQLPHRDR